MSSVEAQAAETTHLALADAPTIVNAPAIEYCSVEFQPFAARPWAAIDLRYSKVLAICDQSQALGSMKVPHWTYVAPSVLRIPDAHPVDLASEAEFLKSCSSLPLKELDAVIVLKDLTGMPIKIFPRRLAASLHGIRPHCCVRATALCAAQGA